MKPQAAPQRGINAVKDITEIDLTRQRYYQLMAEQAAWNLKKVSKRKSIWA